MDPRGCVASSHKISYDSSFIHVNIIVVITLTPQIGTCPIHVGNAGK